MAVIITDTCISCGACLDECPTESIVDNDENPTGEDIYFVMEILVTSVKMENQLVLKLVQLKVVLFGAKILQAMEQQLVRLV